MMPSSSENKPNNEIPGKIFFEKSDKNQKNDPLTLYDHLKELFSGFQHRPNNYKDIEGINQYKYLTNPIESSTSEKKSTETENEIGRQVSIWPIDSNHSKSDPLILNFFRPDSASKDALPFVLKFNDSSNPEKEILLFLQLLNLIKKEHGTSNVLELDCSKERLEIYKKLNQQHHFGFQINNEKMSGTSDFLPSRKTNNPLPQESNQNQEDELNNNNPSLRK